MKVSKCKKELARIISEHGGWRNGEFAAQDGDGGVGGYGSKPEWNSLVKYWWREALGGWFLANKIKNHHQTVLSRAEYFHLYPAPDADGWIEWSGGECPVADGVALDVKRRDGDELTIRDPEAYRWNHIGSGGDFVAYRPHRPGRLKPEFCESVMRSIPEPTAKPTIEQLAAGYRNAKGYAERKQQEADEAKADADEALRKLELAGEEIGIIVTPITAKQEPELVITDWRDLQVDDVIELTGSVNPCWEEHSGSEMTVKEVYRNQGDNDDQVDLLGGSGRWSLGGNSTWRFIRRP